jgi:hypothetical protein
MLAPFVLLAQADAVSGPLNWPLLARLFGVTRAVSLPKISTSVPVSWK